MNPPAPAPRELITDIDYTYVDRVVSNIRSSLSITGKMQPVGKGPLLSIHMQSNRPDNLSKFLIELEASLDKPSRVEVVVKIDDTDTAMNELLPRLVKKHRVAIKFISTPLVGGFFELWSSMNDMLKVCHPNAYFLWNMNDEMAILNRGWDTVLEKYVGLFPDHIFRLRTSLFRFRNYYDFWECGFAPETSGITTKRWIDICGNWNPCMGPDSFNQCVSYYLGYHDRFDKHKILRDVPIHDILLAGEGAFIGLEGDKLWRRMRGATKAWYKLMSYKIQTEASRRSQKLVASIWAYEHKIDGFRIWDDNVRRRIILYDKTGTVCRDFRYGLSYLRITLANMWRTTQYYYYGGGGEAGRNRRFSGIFAFLALRYDMFEWMHNTYLWSRRERKMMVRNRNDVMPSLIMRYPGIFAPNFKSNPYKRQTLAQHITLLGKRAIQVSMAKIRQRNTGVSEDKYVLDFLQKSVDWSSIYILLNQVEWPRHLANHGKRMILIRCVLLKYWYRLSDGEMDTALRHDPAFQRFAFLPSHISPPSSQLIADFKICLQDAGIEKILYQKVDVYLGKQNLPERTLFTRVA